MKETPRLGTTASRNFFISWAQVNRFFNFVLSLVGHVEHTAKAAHEALVDTAHSEEERAKLLEEWEERIGPTEELSANRQFFLEVVLVRHIENYLNYLSGLLYEIFTQRPETLKSGQVIEIESVLSHSSMEDLVRGIAGRKVESLSYGSFLDLADYFEDHFGLELTPAKYSDVLVEAIETRNLSVHNRCIINERYVAKTKSDPKKIGDRREIFIDTIDWLVPFLADQVKRLDTQARKKLKLRDVRFNVDDYVVEPKRKREGRESE